MADLEVVLEDNQLTIRGRRQDEPDREFLHRGITARQFQRSFVLADGIEVVGATLERGLLNIDFVQPQQHRNARLTKINAPEEQDQPQTIDVD